MTVRRALTDLVNEGLLERRHGSGTYVARPKVTYDAREMVNYVQAMQKRNVATGSQLIEFGEIVASRRLAELLELEIGNPIYRVVILRLANRVPVILERGFFPCEQLSKAGRLGSGEELDHRSVDHNLQDQTWKDLSNGGGRACLRTDYRTIAG